MRNQRNARISLTSHTLALPSEPQCVEARQMEGNEGSALGLRDPPHQNLPILPSGAVGSSLG